MSLILRQCHINCLTKRLYGIFSSQDGQLFKCIYQGLYDSIKQVQFFHLLNQCLCCKASNFAFDFCSRVNFRVVEIVSRLGVVRPLISILGDVFKIFEGS